MLGKWAGLVASVTDRGTFCVCSPFTNGQLGECRSCSDLESSEETFAYILKLKYIAELLSKRSGLIHLSTHQFCIDCCLILFRIAEVLEPMALFINYIIHLEFNCNLHGLGCNWFADRTINAQLTISTHHGSSVGSQQTRHTLQVKHMALSSPVEAGCGSQASIKYKNQFRSREK